MLKRAPLSTGFIGAGKSPGSVIPDAPEERKFLPRRTPILGQ